MLIRPATSADISGVTAIYDEQVRTGISTFDLEPPLPSYWQHKLDHPAHGDHFLVATSEVDAPVLGYAYSSTYRPRPAYDGTREVSVYLAAEARGQRLGRRLYDELHALLRADGVHTALAVIALPNDASEALHRSLGYERVGVLPEVGHKFGRWIDTAILALRLT